MLKSWNVSCVAKQHHLANCACSISTCRWIHLTFLQADGRLCHAGETKAAIGSIVQLWLTFRHVPESYISQEVRLWWVWFQVQGGVISASESGDRQVTRQDHCSRKRAVVRLCCTVAYTAITIIFNHAARMLYNKWFKGHNQPCLHLHVWLATRKPGA